MLTSPSPSPFTLVFGVLCGFPAQDRLKRQRAVDKMQLAKVEREKRQELEQVRACPLWSVVAPSTCISLSLALSLSLYLSRVCLAT